MALPSKILLGSSSSKVSKTLAALRNLFNANWTLHNSLLLRRPYSPTVFNSASRRTFSKGRLGLEKVFESVFCEKEKKRGRMVSTRDFISKRCLICEIRNEFKDRLDDEKILFQMLIYTRRKAKTVSTAREREKERGGRFQISLQKPFDALPSRGRKKNENPTRAQLAPNANDEVKRARLDRTQKHSIQTYALVFIQHLFRIIAASLRANLIFSISRPQKTLKPLLRAQISRLGEGGDEHRGANGRPSRASRKRKLRKSNRDNLQFLKTLADGIV
jgi:hypothetical protein